MEYDLQLRDDLYHAIAGALIDLEPDFATRNSYMNGHYNAVYRDGLWQGIDIPQGEWFAEYNLVRRVSDILVSQLFGRGFQVVSNYSKEDLSAYDNDPQAKQEMQLKNKKLKSDSEARQNICNAIIRDNGGMALFENGGKVGSVMGTTVYKMYPDFKNKKVAISLIERPQNVRFAYKSDNFREWEFAGYVYQITPGTAQRLYGDKLPDGEIFQAVEYGNLFGGDGNTANPLNQATNGTMPDIKKPMVTVLDISGYVPGFAADGKTVKKVDRGKETSLSVMCVGGHVVEIVTDEAKQPKYYEVPNIWVPGQSFGDSDISQSLIDINREIIRLMRDMGVWADKNLWRILLAKGFTEEVAAKLKGKKRVTKLIVAEPEQSMEEVGGTLQPLTEMARMVDQKLDLFVRIAGIGRVLFDDPTVNANSNQALMTTLKGVVDIVESKQKQWGFILREMFNDALNMAMLLTPEMKDILTDDPSWFIDIEWPSVLRREDASYQTMWLNLLNRGAVSIETFMQKAVPVFDTEEEIDRIRDEMDDPITAAMLGNQLAEVAHQTLNKSLGIPPWGYVVPKVQVRGELSPQEMGNIAHNYQWDQGPYGPAIGPTGFEGAQANQDFQNTGMITDTKNGPQANYKGPQQANPQLTADQNTGQSASQPGSGAPAVSPAGANAMAAQNRGA